MSVCVVCVLYQIVIGTRSRPENPHGHFWQVVTVVVCVCAIYFSFSLLSTWNYVFILNFNLFCYANWMRNIFVFFLLHERDDCFENVVLGIFYYDALIRLWIQYVHLFFFYSFKETKNFRLTFEFKKQNYGIICVFRVSCPNSTHFSTVYSSCLSLLLRFYTNN